MSGPDQLFFQGMAGSIQIVLHFLHEIRAGQGRTRRASSR